MPTTPEIKCEQLWEGDSLQLSPHRTKATSATRHFLVSGAENEEAALKALQEHIYDKKLNSYMKMALRSLTIMERQTPDAWKIDAAYTSSALGIGGDDENEEPEESTSYSMSSTTMHVVHSLKTVRKYAANRGTAKDYKGAISVRNGEAEGTDINFTTMQMTITHYFKKRQWSTRLRNKILAAGNRINKRSFRGFEPGELLYLSATISPATVGDKEYVQVDFSFAISPNDDDVELAGWEGGNIKKEGWNFMWMDYGSNQNTANPVPKGVYIEQVYKSYDFTELGLKAKE